jgi:hypothetical protein
MDLLTGDWVRVPYSLNGAFLLALSRHFRPVITADVLSSQRTFRVFCLASLRH